MYSGMTVYYEATRRNGARARGDYNNTGRKLCSQRCLMTIHMR